MKLMHELRGFRNNNPGNLILPTGYVWDGQIIDPMPDFYLDDKPYKPKQEARFCRFISMDWGIRAIYRILKMYRDKYGLETIEGIINRYAPPSENDTESYIKNVVAYFNKEDGFRCIDAHKQKTKYSSADEDKILNKNQRLNFCGGESEHKDYVLLVHAIIHHENGFCPFTNDYLTTIFNWAVPEWLG